MKTLIALSLLALLTACGGDDSPAEPTNLLCTFVGPLPPELAASAAASCPK